MTVSLNKNNKTTKARGARFFVLDDWSFCRWEKSFGGLFLFDFSFLLWLKNNAQPSIDFDEHQMLTIFQCYVQLPPDVCRFFSTGVCAEPQLSLSKMSFFQSFRSPDGQISIFKNYFKDPCLERRSIYLKPTFSAKKFTLIIHFLWKWILLDPDF